MKPLKPLVIYMLIMCPMIFLYQNFVSQQEDLVTVSALATPELNSVPGHGIRLQYNWSSSAPLSKKYSVFVHVLNSKGDIVLQDDHLPPTPTTKWSGSLTYTRNIKIPADFKVGSYSVVIGLYDSTGRMQLSPGKDVLEMASYSYNVGKISIHDVEVKPIYPKSISSTPGQKVLVRYNWIAKSSTQDPYTVFVHFVDSEGKVIFQDDHEPPVPTTRWKNQIGYSRLVSIPTVTKDGVPLAEGSYRIKVGLYNGAKRAPLSFREGVVLDEQGRYEIGSLILRPQAALSASPSLVIAHPGEEAKLTMNWFAQSATASDNNVFVHLVDKNGKVAFQADHIPSVPSTKWDQWKISYLTSIPVPQTVPAGYYDIRVGLYSSTRLALSPGPGVSVDKENRFSVGTLHVVEKSAKVLNAENFCLNENVFDETCVQRAIDVATPGTKIQLPAKTFSFNKSVSGKCSDLTISGHGPGTLIKKDGFAFDFKHCSNFSVQDLNFETVSIPKIIRAEELSTVPPTTLVAIDRWGSGHGYLPSINDHDIYNKLSAAQKAQNFDTGICINTGQNITVTGIGGSYFSLLFYDINKALVSNNKVHGGKNFTGGIAFWKGTPGTSGSTDVEISNNTVVSTTYSGIFVGGVNRTVIKNNTVEYVGESGIKTGQESTQYTSNAMIDSNLLQFSYYDGLDLSSDYPHTAEHIANSTAVNNISNYNQMTGLYIDGQNWTLSGNSFNENGLTGMKMDLKHSQIIGNYMTNNNTRNSPDAYESQMFLGPGVSSDDNTISSNIITNTQGNAGACILHLGLRNTFSGNKCSGGEIQSSP